MPSSTDEVVNPFMLPAKMNSKYLGYEEMNSDAADSNKKGAENLYLFPMFLQDIHC